MKVDSISDGAYEFFRVDGSRVENADEWVLSGDRNTESRLLYLTGGRTKSIAQFGGLTDIATDELLSEGTETDTLGPWEEGDQITIDIDRDSNPQAGSWIAVWYAEPQEVLGL